MIGSLGNLNFQCHCAGYDIGHCGPWPALGAAGRPVHSNLFPCRLFDCRFNGHDAEYDDHVRLYFCRSAFSSMERLWSWNMPTAKWLKALTVAKPMLWRHRACSGLFCHPLRPHWPPSVPCCYGPGVSGKFMSYLPITVIILLSASAGYSHAVPPCYWRSVRQVRARR